MTMDNNMLPLMLMMNQGGSDNSGESGGMDLEKMLPLLMPDMFGKEIVESIAEDMVGFGSARDRAGEPTIGVIEAMVIPPTANDPKVRLRIKSNGTIFARPEHLEQIGQAFIRMSKDGKLKAAYESAKELEPEAEAEAKQKNMTQAAIGG